MKLEELVEKNIKKLEKDISEIKNVVFELNGLTMEIPFITEVDQKEKKNLVKRIATIYTNANDNMTVVNSMNNEFTKKEAEKYIIKLNIYFNAVSILEYSLKIYTDYFVYKFNIDKDINDLINYYKQIADVIVLFTKKYEKYVKNLGYEYYIN